MAKPWSEIRKKSKLTEEQREEDDAWVRREALKDEGASARAHPKCGCGTFQCAPGAGHLHDGGLHSLDGCISAAEVGPERDWKRGDEVELGGWRYVFEAYGTFRRMA